VVIAKGYRFQLYPGHEYASTTYINQLVSPESKRLTCVHVFLTMEKKSKISSNSFAIAS